MVINKNKQKQLYGQTVIVGIELDAIVLHQMPIRTDRKHTKTNLIHQGHLSRWENKKNCNHGPVKQDKYRIA